MLYAGYLSRRLSLLAMLLCLSFSIDASQLLRFEGRALEPESKTLLYTERHQVILDDQGNYISSFVEYLDPLGEVFAEKTLDFSKSQIAPDLMFYDKRHEERTTVTLQTSSGEDAYIRILNERGAQREESRVDIDEDMVVIDAGFDRLITLNWPLLQEKKGVSFSFLAITRSQLLNFKVKKDAQTNQRVSLELYPRNFFIDLLVDPITLEYDLNTQRLMRFTGLTNIERYVDGKRSEENYLADIYYQYQDIQAYTLIESGLSKVRSN